MWLRGVDLGCVREQEELSLCNNDHQQEAEEEVSISEGNRILLQHEIPQYQCTKWERGSERNPLKVAPLHFF